MSVMTATRAAKPTWPPDDRPLTVEDLDLRIPDLVVVMEEDFDLEAKSVTRPPVLAIEVASPSTAMYDRNRRKGVYAKFGIPAYWIVTPSLDKPSLTAFELREGSYVEQMRVTGDQVFRAERPFAVEICPASLVALRRSP